MATRKRLHRNIIAVTLTSFLTDISSEMLINLIPLFLANVLGVRTNVIGLIEGLAESTANLLKIPSGILSDKIKKRKTFAVLGYSISTLAKPFLYFANSWFWVLGVRLIERIGKGIRTAPRDALIADSVSENNRGIAFGLHRAGDTLGAFTGLSIALWIISKSQANQSYLTQFTFRTVVLASIIPAVIAVLVLLIGARDIQSKISTTTESKLNWKNLGKDFYIFLAIVILFTLGNSSNAFITLRAQESGLSLVQIMGMLLTFNAIYAMISSPAGKLSDNIGRYKVLISGWLLYALVYFGIAASKSGTAIWIWYGVYGFYYGMSEGTAKALVADIVKPELRGSAYGFYNAAVGLFAFPASLIAGILWQGIGNWQGFGPTAPFLFGGCAAIIATLGLIYFRIRRRKN